MKHWDLFIWLTQLGMSVAVPLGSFILLAVWLRERFSLGNWVLWVGIVAGIGNAVSGLWASLQIMKRISSKEEDPPANSSRDPHSPRR